MQTIIVIIFVCLAAAYLVKTFTGSSDKKNGCGCGCTSCPTADTCDDKDATPRTHGDKDGVS